jgi:hypothetical protein
VEDLHGIIADRDVDVLAHQVIGHAVPHDLDIDERIMPHGCDRALHSAQPDDPSLLAVTAPESPALEELRADIVVLEIRDGYLKWAHLCPRCGDRIQLPLPGKDKWTLKIDPLRRPTLHPSIWERRSCGAHFFVRRGRRLWCR